MRRRPEINLIFELLVLFAYKQICEFMDSSHKNAFSLQKSVDFDFETELPVGPNNDWLFG